MNPHTSFETRVIYERLPSGLDVALLPTSVNDVVVARIALGQGSYALYDRQAVAALLADLLPPGTATKKRSRVREEFERLGATVGAGVGPMNLYAHLTCRKEGFIPALELLVTVLARPVFTPAEFLESKVGWLSVLEHEKENTTTQVDIACSRALYRKGHPHFSHTTEEKIAELSSATRGEVSEVYPKLLSTVGGLITVGGDVEPERFMRAIRRITTLLPSHPPTYTVRVRPDKVTRAHAGEDIVVSRRDKINVDTQLCIPLALTRDHEDFEPLLLGTAILGGSASARLFNELRTRRSLTYGAYATLDGFGDGYPGYLQASAVFPADVFAKGRAALREVTRTFIERGVTATELAKRKEEVSGKHIIGLSTTVGQVGAVFETILWGRPLSFLDGVVPRLQALRLAHVNYAIRTHIHYEDGVTAACGGVTVRGKPLP